MPPTKTNTPPHRAPDINTLDFWRIGKLSLFPLYLNIPANTAGFSTAQMTYLQAHKQVAWRVAEYLRLPQVVNPGNGADPIVLEYAEKEETVNAFVGFVNK